ncbi:type II secretion system F family protein [Pseudorhodobacter sp. E13]|uniref:type II secretion system F family protein n=1 Tax=Pseudorhodobacter sp. E13 TaxID=2487931 RepID=UPI000F8D65E9|nr:type II secretion system F family protein [Pseudorhodobacter sp. E13]RUS63350.1 type II secretion system F family protein [Pseudorhodobacter sp. E13]
MLETFNQMLVDKLGPLGPLFLLGGLGLVLILVTLPTMLKKKPEPFAKLKTQRDEAKGPKAQGLRMGSKGGASDKLQKFSTFLEPQNAEEMSAARLKLHRAGYRAKNSVQLFHFSQLVLGIGLLILGVAYAMFLQTQGEVSTQKMILCTIIPGAAGYYLPQYWVQRRIQQRQEEIVSGFPDALDMMLVCVEAGQSLDQSIMRIAKESRAGYPALADEFDTVAHEVKAGKERVAVLKDMSDRVGIADVSSFVTTLVQSATFGTSIAEALRVYSAEMRDKRVMRAEEKANKLPTKLTLGTMLFTVPPLMIILIGPSVHGISKTLGGG